MASSTASHHKRHSKPPEASRRVSLRRIVKQRLNVVEFAAYQLMVNAQLVEFAAHQPEYKHQIRPQLGAKPLHLSETKPILVHHPASLRHHGRAARMSAGRSACSSVSLHRSSAARSICPRACSSLSSARRRSISARASLSLSSSDSGVARRVFGFLFNRR